MTHIYASSAVDEEDYFGLEMFSPHELLVATDHFSGENIIGHGAFCVVYKGRLVDGSVVAVKRLTERAPVMVREELEISSIVSHRNVIGLLGVCITKRERLLVYPYMANGSVASYLRGEINYVMLFIVICCSTFV